MRIQINLSRQPFQNNRPLIVTTAILSTLLLLSLGVLSYLAFHERQQVADLRETVDALESRSAILAKEESTLRAEIRRGENGAVFDRSVFLNSLILPKAISWSLMFNDLEGVVPHNVRLVSIRPQVNAQNQIVLDMVVAAKNGEPVIDLLKRMEGSARFTNTQVASLTPPSQNDDTFKYRITVIYAQKL